MPTRWQNSTEAGSPPCSPQIPTLRAFFVFRPPPVPVPLHSPPPPLLVQPRDGIFREQLPLEIERQELPDVVAAVAEGHLGEVVGAEGEEVGMLGHLFRAQRGPGRPHKR